MVAPEIFGCDNNTYFVKPKKSQGTSPTEKGYITHFEQIKRRVSKHNIKELILNLRGWTNNNNNYIFPSLIQGNPCISISDFKQDQNYNFCRVCDTFCMTGIKFLFNTDIPPDIYKIKWNDVQIIYSSFEEVDSLSPRDIENIKKQNKLFSSKKLKNKSYKSNMKNTSLASYNILNSLFSTNSLFEMYITYNNTNTNKPSLGKFKLKFPFIKFVYNTCPFKKFISSK